MNEQTLVEGKESQLAVFSPVEAMIAEYAEENKNLVFDYRDPLGNKEARSHIYKLRRVKTEIANVHKSAKAEALEVCRKIDAYKNKLTGQVEKMISVHDEPIKQIEREEAEAEAERQRVTKEAEEKAEKERLAELERREAEVKAKEEALAKQEAEEVAREAAQIERAREKRIAEEATAKAEAEKKAALEAAEKKRIADIEAERQRLKAEQQAKELAEIRRKEAEAEAERKRVENKRHRAKIEGEILAALCKVFPNEDIIRGILQNIMEGKIPHVTINY